MATATSVETSDGVRHIGKVAGMVWHTLREEKSMSTARLSRTVDAPRDLVMQAIGWLAREEKVVIIETSRGKMISLCEEV